MIIGYELPEQEYLVLNSSYKVEQGVLFAFYDDGYDKVEGGIWNCEEVHDMESVAWQICDAYGKELNPEKTFDPSEFGMEI